MIVASIFSHPTELIDDYSQSSDYAKLASKCLIDDYESWTRQRQELFMWAKIVEIFKLPIDQDDLLNKELEKYRLQQECLRVVERIPLSIGPG